MRSQSLHAMSASQRWGGGEVNISFPFALSLRYRWKRLKKLSMSIRSFYVVRIIVGDEEVGIFENVAQRELPPFGRQELCRPDS